MGGIHWGEIPWGIPGGSPPGDPGGIPPGGSPWGIPLGDPSGGSPRGIRVDQVKGVGVGVDHCHGVGLLKTSSIPRAIESLEGILEHGFLGRGDRRGHGQRRPATP